MMRDLFLMKNINIVPLHYMFQEKDDRIFTYHAGSQFGIYRNGVLYVQRSEVLSFIPWHHSCHRHDPCFCCRFYDSLCIKFLWGINSKIKYS